MDSQQGAAPQSAAASGGILIVDAASRSEPMCLALLDPTDNRGSGSPQRAGVTFEGIALGPGVYVDAAERRIRVRESHLAAVAERVRGVFLRDLHREDMGASVGVVAAARVEAGEVRFTGDVRLAPYVDIVREFWPHVRFSLGFRYDPSALKANEDGTYDLPSDFLIDHLALVPQGQYANARLVRLLNQARGLTNQPSRSQPDMTDDPNGTAAASEASRCEQLRQQRDDALRKAESAEAASEASRCDLGKARADLDLALKAVKSAEAASEASRCELGQAKNRVAAEVMKLELAAGKDFDLDQHKKELTSLDLAALDKLRGELRLAARAGPDERNGGAAAVTGADPPAATAREPARNGLDLAEVEQLGLNDTLRLAFAQGVL
jgi:hypothetical protein